MKLPSVSFSKDALVAFLLKHCEKMVVAVIGLIALLLAWNGLSAFRHKSAAADRRPEAIIRLTNETVQHIDAEPNAPAEAMGRRQELAKAIDPWRPSQVKLAAPPDVAPLSRPTVASVTLRGDPQVFPIEDLRAVAGVAVVKDQLAEQAANAIAALPAPDPSGSESSGETGNPDYDEPSKRFEKLVPCVVLVGLIPVAKQRAEYRKVLPIQADDPSSGMQPDVPRWGDFVVERAAANVDKPEAWLPIRPRLVAEQGAGKPLPDRFLLRTEDLTQAGGASGYAASLPPRLYQPWGLDTVHPWFLQPRHKWRLERGEQIAETPVRLEPADFRRHFADHVGHVVEIGNMKFVGPAQRSGAAETVIIGVAAADGPETFPPPDPVSDDSVSANANPAEPPRPVFVIATAWHKTLDTKAFKACNLRVVTGINGGMPIAQIIGVTPLDDNDSPGVEQRDPRAGPGAGLGDGFASGGGGAAPPPGLIGGEGGGLDEGAEYRLFRFVDDTVEFGKTYRYRVKIELANPNWGLDPKILVNAKSADTELLEAESMPSSPVMVPFPYVVVARASLDSAPVEKDYPEEAKADGPKPTAPKAQQLGKSQVEVSFLGPSWLHMRGKRPEQGYDYFDYAMEHVAPVEPGGPVLWRRPRKTKEKSKADSRTAKDAERPRPMDPSWKLLTTVDVGRDLVDFRGRQTSDGGVDSANKDTTTAAGFMQEPVELALLRSDGSLEVVTAAESQRLVEAFDGMIGDGAGISTGPDTGMPGRERPMRMQRPVP